MRAVKLNKYLDWDPDLGVAWQRDRTKTVEYGQEYFNKYVGYQRSEIANKINDFRCAITEKYCRSLLDVGIGSGEFILRSKLPCFGYDVNPIGVAWLRERGLYVDPYERFPGVDGVTLWDCLEHLPEPAAFLDLIPSGVYLFLSLPIFADLSKVRRSRHYRPNEHFWYFTRGGLVGYVGRRGFDLIEESDAETRAGRKSIGSFVFRRVY